MENEENEDYKIVIQDGVEQVKLESSKIAIVGDKETVIAKIDKEIVDCDMSITTAQETITKSTREIQDKEIEKGKLQVRRAKILAAEVEE